VAVPKGLFEAIRAQGGLVKLHICGNINHLLPHIGGLGVDILDIDQLVDPKKAREASGPRRPSPAAWTRWRRTARHAGKHPARSRRELCGHRQTRIWSWPLRDPARHAGREPEGAVRTRAVRE
jgi:hypothetical protein